MEEVKRIENTKFFVKVTGSNRSENVIKQLKENNYDIIPTVMKDVLLHIDNIPYVREYLENIAGENGHSNYIDYCQADLRGTFDELYNKYPQEMSYFLVEVLEENGEK